MNPELAGSEDVPINMSDATYALFLQRLEEKQSQKDAQEKLDAEYAQKLQEEEMQKQRDASLASIMALDEERREKRRSSRFVYKQLSADVYEKSTRDGRFKMQKVIKKVPNLIRKWKFPVLVRKIYSTPNFKIF